MVALIVTILAVPSHTGLVAVTVAVALGNAFTVIVMALEVAVAVVTQVSFEVRTADTWSFVMSAALVNVLPPVPTFVPLTFHWKDGALPPLATLAVNVVLLPAHTVVDGVEIDMLGTKFEPVVTVVVFEVAVALVRHVALEVRTAYTLAPPLTIVVYTLPVVAVTGVLFKYH